MQTIPLHRFYHVSGVIAAIVLSLLLLGTPIGRYTLVWIYLQSAGTMTNATHIHGFSLDNDTSAANEGSTWDTYLP